ncbi:hypothetical protein OIU78_018339 [Salix suchowensis]|nr:hypothetical protein OIU78_018339 [Salix suchowensis]
MAKSEIDGGTCDPSHGEDDEVIVDIESLTSSIESMMSENLIMSDKCCMFRVPPFSEGITKELISPMHSLLAPGTVTIH